MGLKDRLRNLERRLGVEPSEEVLFVECTARYDRQAQETYDHRDFEIHSPDGIRRFETFEDVEEYIEGLQARTGKRYRTILICKVYPEGGAWDELQE